MLTALTGVEPARVGGECCKPGQCNMYTAWMAPDSVLGAMLAIGLIGPKLAPKPRAEEVEAKEVKKES